MKKIGIIDYFIDEWHSNTEPFAKEETLVILSIRDAILKGTHAPYGEEIFVEDYDL